MSPPFIAEKEYLFYYFHNESTIEDYLDKISKNIVLTSNNDTEKTQNIIQWENKLPLNQFNINSVIDQYLRNKSNKTSWYIFIKKANCRERSLIFEDIADRTNLSYRRIEIDGFINPNNFQISNHRWDEVYLDSDWRIADSGFSLYYPQNNNTYFTSDMGYLIGHVAVLDANGKYMEDRTNSYVNRISKLILVITNNGEPIDNADVFIKLKYQNITSDVVGQNLKVSSNESGICEINLGVYNDTSYIVNVSRGDLFGQKNVTIGNEQTNIVLIELNNTSLSRKS